jgi:hypothetical protein
MEVQMSTGFDPATNTPKMICWIVRESVCLGCIDVCIPAGK